MKRADWSSNGELLTIQKISDILRDGFNKLVGFGAIFGVGTAGASVARAKITGSSVSSSTAITGGFENLINLNFNFLVSAILWTTALLFIVTSVSLTGNVITALSYLNSDHLFNVKKMRTKLQQKEVFLGTTQPSMDHANIDTSVYYDSKQGIDSALSQQLSSQHSQPMPDNKVITKQYFSSEDDLTQIIITNPKDSDISIKSKPKEEFTVPKSSEFETSEESSQGEAAEDSSIDSSDEHQSSSDESLDQDSTNESSDSTDSDENTTQDDEENKF